MRLAHYGIRTAYLPNHTYDPSQRGGYMKPQGFWVSDEDDYGWADWCLENDFGITRLRNRHEVMLADDANIIYLHNIEQLMVFHKEWAEPEKWNNRYDGDRDQYWHIPWEKVAEVCDGIIITPHMYTWRLELPSWYWGWDCASGVIWNLRAIKSVKPAPLLMLEAS